MSSVIHEDEHNSADSPDRRRSSRTEDDDQYISRHRSSTSRSQSRRRSRSLRRSRSPRRERERRSRSPRTPSREKITTYPDTYRPPSRRTSYNGRHEDRRERDDRPRDVHHRERTRVEKRERSRSRSGRPPRPERNYSQRLAARETAAMAASQRSQKDCRVYVGNLAYEVKWAQLKDFMRQAGEVVYADVLTQANGMSKGCGVVEYRTPEDARRAIETLNDTPLLGRPVFIREDRENEAKFGTSLLMRSSERNVSGGVGVGGSIGGGGGSSLSGGYGSGNVGGNAGRQIFVGNLPYSVGWQELKDLFRNAGNIIRADILIGPDRRSKGSGTVLFETPSDAANAISMYDGYDWNGRRIEVREDRFAGGPPPPRFASRLNNTSTNTNNNVNTNPNPNPAAAAAAAATATTTTNNYGYNNGNNTAGRPYAASYASPIGGMAGGGGGGGNYYGAPGAGNGYASAYGAIGVGSLDQYDGYGGYGDYTSMMDYSGGGGWGAGGYGPYGGGGYDMSTGYYGGVPGPGMSTQIFVRNVRVFE